MLTMVKELHAHQKAPSLSTVTPATNPFQSRPFAVQTKPEHSSPQQELPDSETQQETVKRFSHSLANISISAPSAPPPDAWKQPLLQRQPRISQEEVDLSLQMKPASLPGLVIQRPIAPEAGIRLPQIAPTTISVQRDSPKANVPSPQPRQDFVFIMGKDTKSSNKFYTSAQKYFTANFPKANMVTTCHSLDAIFRWIRTVSSSSAPVGNLYIVSHANQDGTLSFPLEDGDKNQKIGYGDLKKSLKDKSALFKLSGEIDEKTIIHIKGCNIGRSKKMLDLLDQAFGGRSQVTAPTHKQGYEYHSAGKGKDIVTSEFFSHYIIEFPGKVNKTPAEQLAAFKSKYSDLNLSDKDWAVLVPPKTGAKRLADRKLTYTYEVDDGAVPSDQEAIALAQTKFKNYEKNNPQHELARPEIYDWRVESKGKGKSQTLTVILEMTSYVIEKELQDNKGARIHPQEKAGTYFGESTYDPPKKP